MGLFSVFKEIKQERKKYKQYLLMNKEEMSALDDDELMQVLIARISLYESYLDIGGCLESFKGAKRIFYIVNYFDREVQNGGLCQFFVNSSREIAPYLMDTLNTIGADKYIAILNQFITEHHIDLNDLSSFEIRKVSEYEAQFARYPFDDFDDAYYDLYEEEALDDLLLAYSKLHLEDFE